VGSPHAVLIAAELQPFLEPDQLVGLDVTWLPRAEPTPKGDFVAIVPLLSRWVGGTELKRLPKDELRNPPADRCDPKTDAKKSVCPPYKVGDQVEITGTWKLSSPHSERNSDGLLVYKKMKNVTQAWESPVIEPKPGAQGTPPAPTKPSPQDLVKGSKSSG